MASSDQASLGVLENVDTRAEITKDQVMAAQLAAGELLARVHDSLERESRTWNLSDEPRLAIRTLSSKYSRTARLRALSKMVLRPMSLKVSALGMPGEQYRGHPDGKRSDACR